MMTRDELARVIGDLVLQTLELQAQVAALKKKMAESSNLGEITLPTEPVAEPQE